MGIIQTFKNIFISDVKNDISTDDSKSIREFFSTNSKTITSSNAQKIATVFSCVNMKANALSVIPIRVYKYTGKGKERDRDNPLYRILRKRPNPKLSASLYKKMISQDIDLRGNHYTQIVRNGLGQVVSLYPLIADKMQVAFNSKNEKIFTYDGSVISNNKILHIIDIPDSEGLKGLSRIEYAKQELEFADNSSIHGNKIFKNGSNPSGAFETSEQLTDEGYQRLKEEIVNKYTGLNNTGTPLLLEGGLTFKPLSIKNSDAEWLASRKFNREQVASIFGVNSSMINDSENTSYGNFAEKRRAFNEETMTPIVNLIEEEFDNALINHRKDTDVFIKIEYNDIYNSSLEARTTYYKTLHAVGAITPNEIRNIENMNSYDGGDEHYLQLNLSTVKNLNKGEPSE